MSKRSTGLSLSHPKSKAKQGTSSEQALKTSLPMQEMRGSNTNALLHEKTCLKGLRTAGALLCFGEAMSSLCCDDVTATCT